MPFFRKNSGQAAESRCLAVNKMKRDNKTFGQLVLSAVFLVIIVLQRIFRANWPLMHRISETVVRPIHRFLMQLTGKVRFSAAEVIILAFGAVLVIWLAVNLIQLITKPGKRQRLVHIFLGLITVLLGVYAGFCVLWGVYYYGENFEDTTGIAEREISSDELGTVTEYFAMLANEYADRVERDETGLYAGNRDAILKKSQTLYRETEKVLPGLAGPEVPVKPFFFSRLMSLTDFTGFFFPFTGEANVNTDFPPSQFAATVAHEIAHQRGVAREQEANFCAVLASLNNGDPDYVYSASLMAYTYLGNALYTADHERWEAVYSELDDRIILDFRADQEYWKRYETPVREISNTVYEEFLYSYDQELGLKSYGACVDLLVSYYLGIAESSVYAE